MGQCLSSKCMTLLIGNTDLAQSSASWNFTTLSTRFWLTDSFDSCIACHPDFGSQRHIESYEKAQSKICDYINLGLQFRRFRRHASGFKYGRFGARVGQLAWFMSKCDKLASCRSWCQSPNWTISKSVTRLFTTLGHARHLRLSDAALSSKHGQCDYGSACQSIRNTSPSGSVSMASDPCDGNPF